MSNRQPDKNVSALGDEPPEQEQIGTAEPPALEDVVEKLLDEVGIQTQPRPLLNLEGLRGKVAVVSGGSAGIGRAIAMDLGRAGAHVAFCFLDTGEESRSEAHDVVSFLQELDVRVHCEACDVRDPEQVNAFVANAVERLGGVHIVVNNAGVGRDRALWHMNDDEWSTVLDTNLSGAFHLTRAAAPHLRLPCCAPSPPSRR